MRSGKPFPRGRNTSFGFVNVPTYAGSTVPGHGDSTLSLQSSTQPGLQRRHRAYFYAVVELRCLLDMVAQRVSGVDRENV